MLHAPYFIVVLLIATVGCSRQVQHHPAPKDGQAVNGMVYTVIRVGDGLLATDGGIWGVETKLISHTEPGCKYPCTRYMLYRRMSNSLEPWNALVRTMREGEVRRVWLDVKKRDEPLVYDVELASVVRTDSAGEPIIENR